MAKDVCTFLRLRWEHCPRGLARAVVAGSIGIWGQDEAVMHLLRMILKATGKKGVPQGGVISPSLSNLYLNEVDRMLEKAIATTRYRQYTSIQYARFADDLVILIDSHPRHDWLVKAVEKRLREELAKLRVEINEEKSRMVDLAKGG